jgi:hypothetical protein
MRVSGDYFEPYNKQTAGEVAVSMEMEATYQINGYDSNLPRQTYEETRRSRRLGEVAHVAAGAYWGNSEQVRVRPLLAPHVAQLIGRMPTYISIDVPQG